MNAPVISLDDKYTRLDGRVFLTGVQALARLPLDQQRLDAAAGHRTAGFISGYRGSPLGGLDKTLWSAREHLQARHIYFQPGVNEDLAATSVWGSQQTGLFAGARYDGVFGMWYGKGPGVDRSGDAFKHGNAAGTAPLGGVLVLAGDDHTCKSSTLPHQSEYAFIDAQMPILNPAGVAEILDFGLIGFALSRYSGCWIGFKTIAETVDSSASVSIHPQGPRIVIPVDFEMPAGGLHIRWPDKPLEQELRLQRDKLYAALAFARANGLNRLVIGSPKPRFGIVTAGKSYLDVRQALDDLGVDDALAAEIGLVVYKVGMTWPLERDGIREFASGLEEVLVVEEKRAVIENQLKEQLYNWDAAVRPRIIGKFDERGEWILPSANELTPARIARVIAARIGRFFQSETIEQRLAFLAAKEAALDKPRSVIERIPHFCSGCPHNTSTRVPPGSRALAGIGCHYMATWMDRDTQTFTQMGAEGTSWIGQAPFTETRHVFANLGDGTYFHSGILAIRAAVAARVNITYKILYNDAVAMTGGQPMDGDLSVPKLAAQVLAEGVGPVLLVSDEPDLYRGGLPHGVAVHHRDDLDRLQRELRESNGVSVIIYAQTCATEKRRRRKRGLLADPPKRVFINTEVCEGCGDCGVQSNCLSVVPLETPLGRKRTIDQSACNKDFSCINGFCPSFVSVHGGALKKPDPQTIRYRGSEPQEPELPDLDQPYGILVTGVGGTGVVTIGALLGMAAHLDGHAGSVLDMTGLAQKYGAVVSHVRIARDPGDIHAVRIAAGGARLVLGCDEVVAAGFESLSKIDKVNSRAVVNSHESATAQFISDPDLEFPGQAMRREIMRAAGKGHSHFIEAQRLAMALLGDAIGTNLLMVGYAWQLGYIPISRAALDKAIELNGVAVAFNREAFQWGRRAAVDPDAVAAAAQTPADESSPAAETLDAIIAERGRLLTAYQDPGLAERYRALVETVRTAEAAKTPGRDRLTRTVARNYAKLLAYKDEYEVARLLTSSSFQKTIGAQMRGDWRLRFHLAPPLIARPDALTGRPRKREFGAWIMPVMRVLARFKFLRGGWADPFGYGTERRAERALIDQYQDDVATVMDKLTLDNHAISVDLLALPERIRGFGPVKAAAMAEAATRRAALRAALAEEQNDARAA